jgi:hypothetical protein
MVQIIPCNKSTREEQKYFLPLHNCTDQTEVSELQKVLEESKNKYQPEQMNTFQDYLNIPVLN